MTQRIQQGGLQVAESLFRLVEEKIAPGTGVTPADFWSSLESILTEFMPRNEALLKTRDDLQHQIDAWHTANPGPIQDMARYKRFLTEIGYLLPEPANVSVTTANVDEEIAVQAGPQLVVPVKNARFALNAANARWGSLYDALYGTDAISEDAGAEKGGTYNPVRGAKVIAFAKAHLDQAAPLAAGSHADVVLYKVCFGELRAELKNGAEAGLHSAEKFVGFRGTEVQMTPLEEWCVKYSLHINNGLIAGTMISP